MFTIKLQFHIFSCLPIMENVDKEADKVVDELTKNLDLLLKVAL